jgi:hypothetical protein
MCDEEGAEQQPAAPCSSIGVIIKLHNARNVSWLISL